MPRREQVGKGSDPRLEPGHGGAEGRRPAEASVTIRVHHPEPLASLGEPPSRPERMCPRPGSTARGRAIVEEIAPGRRAQARNSSGSVTS